MLLVPAPGEEQIAGGFEEVRDSLAFIDLFAGLGGFHLALRDFGHRCVFASEIEPQLRKLYHQNFSLEAAGDVRKIDAADIPPHDLLCAGFPCQPFSKAGDQSGLDNPLWGDLFFHILRILRYHQPRFIMLENVPNFEKHDGGRTWAHAMELLRAEGYELQQKRLSPHRFGIPQNRERIFIVGDRHGLQGFAWPEESDAPVDLRTVLDSNPPEARQLSAQLMRCIATWQAFLDGFPPDEELPSFPVWGMEFGATYPFEEVTPYCLSLEELGRFRGAHGIPLTNMDRESAFASLPSYARSQELRFPKWKQNFIRQNRELYHRHSSWLDEWRPQLLQYSASLQKLEWNAKGEPRQLSDKVLQVRASGLRAKRPTTAPSLVAMTTTQVPIIAWENRYMTPRECAHLQSMDRINLPGTPTRAYTALGNAVNVKLLKLIAKEFLPPRQPDSRAHSLTSQLPLSILLSEPQESAIVEDWREESLFAVAT